MSQRKIFFLCKINDSAISYGLTSLIFYSLFLSKLKVFEINYSLKEKFTYTVVLPTCVKKNFFLKSIPQTFNTKRPLPKVIYCTRITLTANWFICAENSLLWLPEKINKRKTTILRTIVNFFIIINIIFKFVEHFFQNAFITSTYHLIKLQYQHD